MITPKTNLTTFARLMVYLLGLSVISICAILIPELAREEAVGKVNPPSSLPFIIGAWILSLPIFIVLHQILKLLNYVEQKTAFSPQSVKAIQNIKYCALSFTLLIAISALATVIIGKTIDPTEDFAPIITIGTIITFASTVITTVVAVLQKLLHQAIQLKSENDLIV